MFCSNCGNEITGKFCSNCGSGAAGESNNSDIQQPVSSNEEVTLWEGQPAGISGKIKSSMKMNGKGYKITNQRVIVTSGIIGKKQNEVELVKIKDLLVDQSLTEKLTNVGNVKIISTDITMPVVEIEEVKNPFEVKDIIRKAMLERKEKMGISYREHM